MISALSVEIESRRAEIAGICARLGVRRLELFGSGTRSSSPRDLDFLVDLGDRPPKSTRPRTLPCASSLRRCLPGPLTSSRHRVWPIRISGNAWSRKRRCSMRLEARKYLRDIQVAAERIERFTRGRRFEQYLADEMLRSAVERQFSIIGEALSRLDKDSPDVAAAIPDHGRIIAFRNILIHGYAAVDDRIVWGVIENHLASLRNAVDAQLATP